MIPVVFTFGAIFFVVIAYCVDKYTTYDVRFGLIRGLAYALSLLVLIVIYYFVLIVVSQIVFGDDSLITGNPVGILTSFGLVFIFRPIKTFFDKLTKTIFYMDVYDSNDLFRRINRSLTNTTDLKSMLEIIAADLAMALRSTQVFFYIHQPHGRPHEFGTDGFVRLPRADVDLMTSNSVINKRLITRAKNKALTDDVMRMMRSHNIDLVVPMKSSGELIGYMILGNRLFSNYTNRDLWVLKSITSELAIAIQNALSIQQIRDLNEHLEQKVANATRELRGSNNALKQLDEAKNEFISMASHQLRTPLTSVKGYLSMVLEGDAGKITSEQKKFLEEAYLGSERMVNLIEDFLNVSRLQTGKFIIDKHEVDLIKLVKQELDSLMPNAKARKMSFDFKYEKDIPTMMLDEGKMREVVMNFADNAVYYSKENSKIRVNLSMKSGRVIFTVQDTGIGVPKSEQGRLFTKFFRASNARKARPDGTGVGLFLAKKVITAHKGEIIFESKEGKGSIFGFSVPINQQ